MSGLRRHENRCNGKEHVVGNHHFVDVNPEDQLDPTHIIQTVHEGQKPFKCSICNSSYTRKMALKKHIQKVHENKNQFLPLPEGFLPPISEENSMIGIPEIKKEVVDESCMDEKELQDYYSKISIPEIKKEIFVDEFGAEVDFEDAFGDAFGEGNQGDLLRGIANCFCVTHSVQGPLITDGRNSCKWTYHCVGLSKSFTMIKISGQNF